MKVAALVLLLLAGCVYKRAPKQTAFAEVLDVSYKPAVSGFAPGIGMGGKFVISHYSEAEQSVVILRGGPFVILIVDSQCALLSLKAGEIVAVSYVPLVDEAQRVRGIAEVSVGPCPDVRVRKSQLVDMKGAAT